MSRPLNTRTLKCSWTPTGCSQHHKDGNVRIAEVDYDPAANYDTGHIPGAVLFDWKKDINDPLRRDILSKEQLEALFSNAGITRRHLAHPVRRLQQLVRDVRVLGLQVPRRREGQADERRKEEVAPRGQAGDEGRPDLTQRPATRSGTPDPSLRVYKDYVLQSLRLGDKVLVDVRGPKEFSGEVLAPPEYPTEHAQRGGHIPGAKNIPWAQTVNDADGTFKTRKDIDALYVPKGVTSDKEVITYCRIGERSSHTWFVLKYLLGYPNVKNYDGSWTEWGNSVGTPVER